MLRKSIWVSIFVLAAGAAIWLGTYYHNYTENSVAMSLPVIKVDSTLPEPGTAPAPDPAASLEALQHQPTGSVKVISLTPNSITVLLSNNSTRSFALSSNTPLYTAVFAGQTGKAMSDIQAGSDILVYPSQADATKAGALAFVRDPSLLLTEKESASFVSGTITKLSGSEVTITPATNASAVTITLDATTKIITSVTAGQKGVDLSPGIFVTASGLSTAGGKTSAKIIFIQNLAR